MITKEFAETATEINVIFDNLSNDIVSKIPINVREFFKKIASDSYDFKYDITKSLNEQELKSKTKGVIALIYRDYICDEGEKKEFNEKYNSYLENQERIKNEKYNPDDLFKSSKEQVVFEQILPIVYEKEKWYKKILNLFKHIFFK